jgi:chemotaxis protein MotB
MRGAAPPVKPKKPPNHERWVISYADLLTLLLAFFVVLYASSTRNKLKMAAEAESFIKAFHGTPPSIVQAAAADKAIMNHLPSPVPKPVEHMAPRVITTARAPVADSQKLTAEMLTLAVVKKVLETMLAPMISTKQVTLDSQPLTLTIELNDEVLFTSGKANLIPQAALLLGKVAGSLKTLPDPFTIVVQGFTDNKPIKTSQFPSNWSLSAERAVSVVQLFADNGVDGNRMAAEGYGPFLPVADNATEAGRSQNRRVQIVIHAPDPSGK